MVDYFVQICPKCGRRTVVINKNYDIQVEQKIIDLIRRYGKYEHD